MTNIFPYDYKVDVNKFEQMLENKASSYKLFWFWGILDEIEKVYNYSVTHSSEPVTLSFSFETVIHHMIKRAWYPVLEYHLNFGASDQLANVVHLINNIYQFGHAPKKEQLSSALLRIEDRNVKAAIMHLADYVPYRLIAPFFRDELRNIPDKKKNYLIMDLSWSKEDVFYQIDSEKKRIRLSKFWYDYITTNLPLVKGWLNHRLIDYLQARNPNTPAIHLKLAPPMERKLTTATKLWKYVAEQRKIVDIYTNLPFEDQYYMNNGVMSIDHFIPWSFVHHDEQWNLVPTFKHVNSSKSNSLPQLQMYLDKMVDLQYTAYQVVGSVRDYKKVMEQYFTINPMMAATMADGVLLGEGQFVQAMKDTLVPLYQIAKNQGYDVWQWTKMI